MEDTTTNATTFNFTAGQQSAFNQFNKFLDSPVTRVYILRGYAGTGKTTLTKSFIKELEKREKKYVLLASTGRAAKILANATNCPTSTVHSLIYKFTDLNQDMEQLVDENGNQKADNTGQLYLNFALAPVDDDQDCVYLVDEASMIADKEDDEICQAMFGSGKLLSDLLNYDPNGKFVFIGDACQLPPVNQDLSPALSPDYFLKNYGLKAMQTELTDIVRQSKDNDITLSAQQLRRLYFHPQTWTWAKFPFRGYKNIHILSSTAELYREYLKVVKEKGYNEATLLSYSNKQCHLVTDIVRPALGIRQKNLSPGDLLLVTQNNYISALMNGDLVTVEEVAGTEKRAGLTFVNVTVKEMFTKKEYTQLLITEVLNGYMTNITPAQQKALYIDFFVRMKKKGIKQKSYDFKRAMTRDPYLNAIRAVYGYALTCHKAQGGEWNKVFLDIPRNLPRIEKPYVYQWIYTAMTRASQELYVVNDFWIM